MGLVFGPDTFDVATDTDIDAYPSGDPDYDYQAGSGDDITVDAGNDRLESPNANNSEKSARCIAVSAMTDQEVRAVVSMGSGGLDDESGAFVRMTPDTPDFTAYQGYLINRTDELEINRHDADGNSTTIASADRGLSNDTAYSLAFRIRGTSLRFQVNGETPITATDANFANGRPGIQLVHTSGVGSNWLDDYEVDDLSSEIWMYEVSAQVAGVGASITPTIPGGFANDNFALLKVTGKTTDGSVMSAPVGWTENTDARNIVEVGATDLVQQVFYRKLVVGDSNPECSLPSNWQDAARGSTVQLVIYRGVHTTTPFDATSVTSSSVASATFTPTGITTATAKAQVVGFVASFDDNALRMSTMRNFTAWMGGASYDTTTGGAFSVGVGSREVGTAGAVTMPTWTQAVNGNDEWGGVALALRSASAATDPVTRIEIIRD